MMENEIKSVLSKAELQVFNEFKLKWKELSEEDIILDGLYTNSIRYVHEYFEKVLKKDLKSSLIIEIGLKSAFQLLADRDLKWAEKLFSHMGFDSNAKIKQICFYTPYKELRDYLIQILTERQLIDEKEREIILYLHQLESHYSCSSIEHAKQLLARKFINDQKMSVNENFLVKDIVKYGTNNKFSNVIQLYGDYVLEWLRDWSIDSCQRCLIDALINSSHDFTNFKSKILWNYLIDHRYFDVIRQWIQKTFSTQENQFKAESNIDQEMIDFAYEKLKRTNEQNLFLNELARYNHYTTEEKFENNFDSFIKRLVESQTFEDYNKNYEFHSKFIQYVLKNNFPVVYLWSYVNKYFQSLSHYDAPKLQNNLFNLMNSFRKLSTSGDMYDASFESIRFVANNYTNSINDFLSDENFGSSIYYTILLQNDKSLMDSLKLDLSKFLELNPQLRLTFNRENDYFNRPISVYQLIQDHTKIDVSKFFTWQKANRLKLAQNSNANTLISHENADFSRLYGYKDTLDYAYFLRQGRPFYAYHTLMTSQMTKYGKIKMALVEEARLRTHLIAINNYSCKRIASACCIFSELVQGNTLKLKLHIHIIENILFDYYQMHGLDNEKSVEKCKNLFVEFLKGDIDAKKMLTTLENALISLLTQKYDDKQLFKMESCNQWLPIMCFCKVYNLQYSLKFLNLSALSNQWLMYLIFSQIYQIPRNQVLSGLENFKDIGVKQHLEYALHNLINSKINGDDGKKLNMKQRKHKSSKIMMQLSESSESDEEFHVNELNNEPFVTKNNELSLESIDFYELLIQCQNALNPFRQLQVEALKWHAPILAIFALFYNKTNKISCLTAFLLSSIEANITLAINELFDLNNLSHAIQLTSIKGHFKTLLIALKIFLPNSLLDIYVKFLYHVFYLNEFNVARTIYSNYKYELIKTTISKHQLLIPLEWYEDVIGKLTRTCIVQCKELQNLNEFILIMGHLNEYRKFTKLVYTLKANKLNISSIEDWLKVSEKSDQFGEICLKALEDLLSLHRFNEAEELADYCELNKDRIYLARIAYQINALREKNDFNEIIKFWKNSNLELMKIGIKDSNFYAFLNVQYTQTTLQREKIILLNLMSQVCSHDTNKSRDLWSLMLNYIKTTNDTHGVKEILIKFNAQTKCSLIELIDCLSQSSSITKYSSSETNDSDTYALNKLLEILINIGELVEAFSVANHYKHYCQDLKIIVNMLYLCLSMVKPEEIDYSTFQDMYDSSSSLKGIRLTNALGSLSRPFEANGPNDRLDCLEKLSSLCRCDQNYCKKIVLYHRISELFGVKFRILLEEDKWSILKNLLSIESLQKYDLAFEIVRLNSFDEYELSNFLIDKLINSLSAQQEVNSFSKLVKLFRSSSFFGSRLLDRTKNMLYTSNDLLVTTELLIKSHDCFIQSCSMDGISKVLQVSRELALGLERAQEFNLMIRLLTGIGHYNEMTYIMDSLWDNHQFEKLFGKNICKKDDKLKLAILDYLKSYHPNDSETYTMVTLNFTMHREIAKMLEDAAYQQLRLLEGKQIENTPEIITHLQSILRYFSDASQSYLKEDCVRLAETCLKKARLIALQISFLSNGKQIINLVNEAATKFVITHSKFWEAFMIAEAYDIKADLTKALFNQFILNNNEKYLYDFKAHINLSTNLIEEIASKFKALNEQARLSTHVATNMKRLIKLSKDICQQYKLAVQLDFKDLIDDMQSKPYASILNDFISNKRI